MNDDDRVRQFEEAQGVKLPPSVRPSPEGEGFQVTLRVSETLLAQMLTDGLRVPHGARIRLYDRGGHADLSVYPPLPVIACPECSRPMQVSSDATIVDSNGEVLNAFLMDAYAARCANRMCDDYRAVSMFAKRRWNPDFQPDTDDPQQPDTLIVKVPPPPDLPDVDGG